MTRKIDMDKLKEISKLWWAIICDLDSKKYNDNECFFTEDGSYHVSAGDLRAIVTDLLKLAEENERLKEQNKILERNSQYLAKKLLATNKERTP